MVNSVQGSRFGRRLAMSCVAVLAMAGCAIALVDQFLLVKPEVSAARSTAAADVASSHAVLNDEWNERITRDTTWRGGGGAWNPGSNNSRNRASRLQGPPQQPGWYIAPSPNVLAPQPPFRQTGETISPSSKGARQISGYRTMCVRMCDGFYFPISAGTSEGNFSRDQTTCTNACPGARLYHYKPDSQEPEDMVDSSGQKYSRMKNAVLFRTQYIESCKCKPHPWEQEANDRHRVYALEDLRRKGNRAVVAELELLKSKNRAEKSNSRRRPADRRRQGTSEEAASPTSESVVAQSSAPRSDANRGQGGDKPLQTLGVMTGSITTAASAATINSVTNSQPQTAQVPAAGSVQAQPAALTGGAMPPLAAADGLPLNGQAQDMPGLAAAMQHVDPRLAEEPSAAPEPAASPIPAATKPRADRQSNRRNRTATRPGGMMRLGGAARGAEPRRNDAPARSRSAEWTRSVFSQ